mgnify:CR=1 FL=1
MRSFLDSNPESLGFADCALLRARSADLRLDSLSLARLLFDSLKSYAEETQKVSQLNCLKFLSTRGKREKEPLNPVILIVHVLI